MLVTLLFVMLSAPRASELHAVGRVLLNSSAVCQTKTFRRLAQRTVSSATHWNAGLNSRLCLLQYFARSSPCFLSLDRAKQLSLQTFLRGVAANICFSLFTYGLVSSVTTGSYVIRNQYLAVNGNRYKVIPVHATKMCGGAWRYVSFLTLQTYLRDFSFTPPTALSVWRRFPVRIKQKGGWAPEPV